MANNPFFFTSLVAKSEIMLSIFVQTFCLSSSPLAMALAMLLLDIALTAFVVAFIGLLVFGNMAANVRSKDQSRASRNNIEPM